MWSVNFFSHTQPTTRFRIQQAVEETSYSWLALKTFNLGSHPSEIFVSEIISFLTNFISYLLNKYFTKGGQGGGGPAPGGHIFMKLFHKNF